MDFKQFNELMVKHFNINMAGKTLFEVAIDKDALWNEYLESFAPEHNKIYKTRRENDCNCCKAFIRKAGNMVAINDDLTVTTLWDFDTDGSEYQMPLENMSRLIISKPITDKFLIHKKFTANGKDRVGTELSRVQNEDKSITTFNHFSLVVPQSIVVGDEIGKQLNDFRTLRNVFKRSLDELTTDSVDTVLELIAQGSLYKGEEWQGALTQFRKLQAEYHNLPDAWQQDNFAWLKATTVGGAVGKIRNHSIGTLLIDLSENVDLDEAVRKYEAVVAPQNYKRPKAIYTKAMLDQAKAKLEQLGYLESLERRYARLDDITVNNILFVNKDSAKQLKGGDVFADMAQGVEKTLDPRRFERVEEVEIKDFIKNVLPTAKKLEVLLDGKHAQNMVSLIAPKNIDSKTMFKWDNNFGWSYAGNVTDSLMRERVKAAGGSVTGVLRFSIQWNELGQHTPNDLDAHCITPRGHQIYFGDKHDYDTLGSLDVDIQRPEPNAPAVENITFPSLDRMKNGRYKFFVHQYNQRGICQGFRAEIEFNGQIHTFDYPKSMKTGERIEVATVALNQGVFTIEPHLQSSMSSREVWGVNTNQFVPVSVLMYSPNYWNEQDGIGHRHYFFMLKGCVNPDRPNGFYNEFLDNKLMEHKRVFEALGSRMAVEPDENQLSGVGFSSTQRNELIVKVTGSTERVIKIKI